MIDEPRLGKITIYPVKSLDGILLDTAVITEGGGLLHDREYAMSDEEGNFIIGKTNPLVHTLRTKYDLENNSISFRPMHETEWNQFQLNETIKIQLYLGNYFGTKVIFHQNITGRFMDIPDISGVTILSTSSLQEVSAWYNNLPLDETRKRFRATIEIDGVSAFWEDHLFSQEGRGIEFLCGDVTIFGMSPRARCVVPTRHPDTGEVFYAFPKTFARHRASTLPEWSKLDNYGHYYFLTVNCFIPPTEIGKWIKTGDKINIVGEKIFY